MLPVLQHNLQQHSNKYNNTTTTPFEHHCAWLDDIRLLLPLLFHLLLLLLLLLNLFLFHLLLLLLSLKGIPIVYYGTEQAFNGYDDGVHVGGNRESLWPHYDTGADL